MASGLEKYWKQFRYRGFLYLCIVLAFACSMLAFWLQLTGSPNPDPDTGRTFALVERGTRYVQPIFAIALYGMFISAFICVGAFSIINRKVLALMVSETGKPGGRRLD